MMNDKDLSTWQTFRRLWPMITPFKAGLIAAAIALVANAASDTFMLSLLKPLLDDGFGKADRSILLWMPLVVIGLMVVRGISNLPVPCFRALPTIQNRWRHRLPVRW